MHCYTVCFKKAKLFKQITVPFKYFLSYILVKCLVHYETLSNQFLNREIRTLVQILCQSLSLLGPGAVLYQTIFLSKLTSCLFYPQVHSLEMHYIFFCSEYQSASAHLSVPALCCSASFCFSGLD